MLALGPLLAIGRLYGEFASAERQYPGLAQVAEWSSFKTVEWVVLLVFCAISIYGGMGLATKRTPDAVSKAKMVLWFNYPISSIVTAMIVPAMMLPDGGKDAAMAISSLIASLIGVAIWTTYLNRSRRVRNTYGSGVETPAVQAMQSFASAASAPTATITPTFSNAVPGEVLPSTAAPDGRPSTPVTPSQPAIPSSMIDEDQIYVLIAEELEAGRPEKGLWTRLFAECGGDEKETRVLYIKQRAQRLFASEQTRLEKLAHEQAAEAAKAKRLRLEGLSLREQLCAANITKGLSERIAELSRTYSAVDLLNKVRLNRAEDVLTLLNQEPLLVAVKNSDGDTALHIALREKYPSMVQLLLEKGSPIEAPNAYGVTPIELASKSNRPELSKLLSAVA